MSLSNEERQHKMMWAANRITNIAYDINPDVDGFNYDTRTYLERMKKLCLELIPSISAGSGNGSFWLLGSDEEVGFSKSTIWSVALYDHIKYAETPGTQKKKEEHRKKKDDREYGTYLDSQDKKLFEIEGYLTDQQLKVYNIYLWCQQFMYASNRYHDELSKQYLPANSKLTLIMNECFNIFNAEKCYATAYMKKKVFSLLLGTSQYSDYEKWDDLTRYIVKCHHMRCFVSYGVNNYGYSDMFVINDLKKMYLKLKNNPSIKDRFWIWLDMFSGKITHKGDEAKLFALCDKLKIKHERVKKIVEKAKAKKKEDEEWNSKNYREEREYDENDLMKGSD